jgi:hypothetical protein
MKRPDFDTFRQIFLDCLSGLTGRETSALAEMKWAGAGDLETRRKLLEAVNDRLKQSYGVEFEINHRLLSVDGPVESAVIQTFHELSTINLMERINAKIRARQN